MDVAASASMGSAVSDRPHPAALGWRDRFWLPSFGYASAGKLGEQAEHQSAILWSAFSDLPLVVIQVGDPLVLPGQILSKVCEVRRWHGQQSDRLIIEIGGRSRRKPTLDVEGSGVREWCSPARVFGVQPVKVDPGRGGSALAFKRERTVRSCPNESGWACV